MATEIKTKKSFGTLDVARISPPLKPESPRAINIHISFEDALKLHFGLGQALAKLNSYNRATTDGKRATVNLSFVHRHYANLDQRRAASERKEGMSIQAGFSLRGRNPDVLTCIANLSNDEVFTPPELANRMLDTLAEAWAADNGGADLWADSSVRFLDPCTKSGVFLREITSRLVKGLEKEIPDLQTRVDHILKNQVFGIAITHLTSLLARRSVYCSKHANGKHSIAKGFTSEAGNVWYERLEHTWDKTKCEFCGAPREILDRKEGLENYTYAFIHTNNIGARVAALFGDDMQFDVIIGNPPYQLEDGGHGRSASAIYHLFVEQAKNLDPRYLTMVIPSRWLGGGKGLNEFRATMLADDRIRKLVDYEECRTRLLESISREASAISYGIEIHAVRAK